jgi:hypothetical protein
MVQFGIGMSATKRAARPHPVADTVCQALPWTRWLDLDNALRLSLVATARSARAEGMGVADGVDVRCDMDLPKFRQTGQTSIAMCGATQTAPPGKSWSER